MACESVCRLSVGPLLVAWWLGLSGVVLGVWGWLGGCRVGCLVVLGCVVVVCLGWFRLRSSQSPVCSGRHDGHRGRNVSPFSPPEQVGIDR